MAREVEGYWRVFNAFDGSEVERWYRTDAHTAGELEAAARKAAGEWNERWETDAFGIMFVEGEDI